MTATSWAWAVHAYGPSRHLKATRCFPSRRNRATPLQTLLARKKNDLKPWLKEYWCLPSAPSGEFVWHMEDVLDVYTQTHQRAERVIGLGVDVQDVFHVPDELATGRTRQTPVLFQPGLEIIFFLACAAPSR